MSEGLEPGVVGRWRKIEDISVFDASSPAAQQPIRKQIMAFFCHNTSLKFTLNFYSI